ncbi:hypothetical protein BGZ95_010164 [Linnemannia exigua]|uniref:Uncharacterized protein n=1 Tax=Linnemannia exigua TaxID=604196 RepID=A0AAD4HAD1_9FUNG|nr:hypothetical protein BGZ95_010164 [Linnemannia exigua]
MICKDWIEAQGFQNRHGASYFCNLKNIRDANPEAYFLFRDITVDTKLNLTREWQRWMHLFKSSGVQCLADLSASQHNNKVNGNTNISSVADNVIERLLVKSRSLRLLATSVEQLEGSDRRLSQLLDQNLDVQRKRPHDRIVEKLRGQDTSGLDKLSTNGLSDLEAKIFSNSRSLIEQAELSTEDSKDLMVGMSGILDTRTWICEEAPSTLEPGLSAENKGLDQLLSQLRKHLQLGIQMLVLKGEVTIGDIAKATIEGQDRPNTTPMLRCIVHLGTLIEYGNLPSSESEVVALWKFILETLSCGQLKFSRATQVAQRLLFLKFGVTGETENGRRVDLLLREGDLEILNTEAKSTEDGGLCEIQYKKNTIRLAHSRVLPM